MERADLPVLLVPEKYELQEPRQFVYATNFSHTDKHALVVAGEMAKLFQAETTVLHFINAYNTPADKQEQERNFDTYAHHIQKELQDYKIRFHLLEAASVSETMENLDKKFPYDVMTMVRRNKTFLEKLFAKSFTRNMAFVTNKLLLVIPEE